MRASSGPGTRGLTLSNVQYEAVIQVAEFGRRSGSHFCPQPGHMRREDAGYV
jgi:hypothetical protein